MTNVKSQYVKPRIHLFGNQIGRSNDDTNPILSLENKKFWMMTRNSMLPSISTKSDDLGKRGISAKVSVQ